jgi:hypothetical protein
MKFNKESIRGKQIMDSARPLLKTISEGIKKPMKFDHGGYHPANTFYVYLETNNPDYLQEHGFGDNPAMQIKADTIYEAIDHVKRNMPEDAEMHSISAYETKKSKGGGIYAIGGMVEHGLMIGDTIIDEYKDYGIIKDKSGDFYVYDPNVGERKKIDGVVYEDIMFTAKKMIDDVNMSYMRRAGLMKDGGDIEKGNLEMIKSNVKEIKHHADELEDQLKSNPEIEAWVLAKADRASTALSDITHYLDGKKYALGGLTPGRFYKDNQGIEYKFVGKIDNGPKKGELLFNDGKNNVYKSLDEFDGAPKENKLFGFFADGGELKSKKNNLLKYLELFPNDAKSWNQATDELRDIARMSRMTYLEVDEKDYPALDYKQLKSPGEWNTKSKSYIKEMYTRMSNKAKKEFLDNFEETFNDKMASGGKVPDDAIESYIKNNMWNMKDKKSVLAVKEYDDKIFDEYYEKTSDKVKEVIDEHLKEAKRNKIVLFRKGRNIRVDKDGILVFSESSSNKDGDYDLMTIYSEGNITHKFTRSPKREAAVQEEYRLQDLRNAPIYRKAKKELRAKFPGLTFSFSNYGSQMNVRVNDVEIDWFLKKGDNKILLTVRDDSTVRISKNIGDTEDASEFVSIVSPYMEEYAIMAKGGKIKNKVLNLKSKLKK